jgi:hypothetical protein
MFARLCSILYLCDVKKKLLISLTLFTTSILLHSLLCWLTNTIDYYNILNNYEWYYRRIKSTGIFQSVEKQFLKISQCHCIITNKIAYDISVDYMVKFMREISTEWSGKYRRNETGKFIFLRAFTVSKSSDNFITDGLINRQKLPTIIFSMKYFRAWACR